MTAVEPSIDNRLGVSDWKRPIARPIGFRFAEPLVESVQT